MQEIFKTHPIYAVEVSNLGNVRGPVKVSTNQRYKRFQGVNKETYEIKFLSVHRLVAELFIRPIPEGMVVNHIDGDKHNNRVDNLEIVTSQENSQHAVDMGLSVGRSGEAHHNSKLTTSKVLEIYHYIQLRYSNQKIAEIMGVDHRTISQIRKGEKWAKLYKSFGMTYIEPINVNKDLHLCLNVLRLLETHTNKEISDMYDLEPSLISRVRSKQTWLKIWKIYEESATTIPQGSTLQANGSGKAEGPTVTEGHDIV